MAWRCSFVDGRVINLPRDICNAMGGVYSTTGLTNILNPNQPGPTMGYYPPQIASTLTPGTFPSSGGYGHNLDLGPVTNAACNFLPAGAARMACLAAVGIFLPGSGGGGGGGGGIVATNCPPGYHRNAAGACQIDGAGGYLPGDVGMQDFAWGTVNGRYGAGYVPLVVQRKYSACPPGSKLGKDGVCYDSLARSNRMHDPGAKPFMTGGEVNVLRRAARIQKRGAKLLRKLTPARKVCAPTKRKKR